MTLRVASIVQDSVTDGPGLRVAVFFQGCPRRCGGCHNPELLTYDGGEEWTAEALLAEILRNPLATGVTFSGGEPMEQAVKLIPLAKEIKTQGYSLWIYTGYLWGELDSMQRELAALADVVVDGPYDASQRSLTLSWRGSLNQRLIDVKGSFIQGDAVEFL